MLRQLVVACMAVACWLGLGPINGANDIQLARLEDWQPCQPSVCEASHGDPPTFFVVGDMYTRVCCWVVKWMCDSLPPTAPLDDVVWHLTMSFVLPMLMVLAVADYTQEGTDLDGLAKLVIGGAAVVYGALSPALALLCCVGLSLVLAARQRLPPYTKWAGLATLNLMFFVISGVAMWAGFRGSVHLSNAIVCTMESIDAQRRHQACQAASLEPYSPLMHTVMDHMSYSWVSHLFVLHILDMVIARCCALASLEAYPGWLMLMRLALLYPLVNVAGPLCRVLLVSADPPSRLLACCPMLGLCVMAATHLRGGYINMCALLRCY